MVAILEKSEHNVDFYPIVDFVKASHLRYALTFKPTVYVSHIRQFWSTVKIETTEEGTKILATIDGNLRTVSKSSIRRNLKLNDEAGISSLPDAELFKNLTLMGYNISPNQKFTFQKGSVFPSVEVSHPYHHAVFESKNPSFSGRIVPLFDSMLIPQGEGSGTPTESRHTPSPEAQPTSPTSHSSSSLPPITTANIPLVIPTAPLSIVVPTDSPQLRHYTRRARIAQSSALPPVAEELASPLRDVSQGEACPTVSSLEAEQDRANIAKTSTLPHESTSRVTSLTAEEGSMQQKFDELTALCTSLEGGGIAQSGDDAPIKGRRLDEGDEAAKKGSNDTEEMINVLTSMDAATVLSSGVVEVPTGSGSIPTSGPPANGVPTGSDEVPTVGPIFATATVVTPYTKRKGKKTMVESDTPKKKKAQDQIDVQLERELEEEMARDAHRMNGQIARDAEIARIHAEEELQMLIDGLDRNNETVAKYLQEYDQFAAELPFERREVKETEEVPEDKVKEMIQLVPVKEVYVEALQVKHLIIDWKVHTKGQRSFWKIIKLGGSSANYQFFVDMLKHLDREDLNQLWRLVKETLSIRPPTSDKEMEIWRRIVGNKMHKAFSLPVMEFPLPEEIPTASEKSSHCQKKRDATAEKIALLMKSSSNCQSKSYDSYTKIETMDEEIRILAIVDGIQRTVSESSLRRNLKLRDEDGIVSIPDTKLFENLTLMGARIAQSSALPTVADEPASPVRDVSEGEACPTESNFIADQDRATIVKSSTLPHDSAPRVTSSAADEGSMQHNIFELTALCTSLQRQYSELQAKFHAQEEEIVKLKDMVKVLEDREGVTAKQSRDDAPIKGRSINEGKVAAERISNNSEEIARVLTSMDAATVLAGGIDVPTGSGFIPTAGPPATVISTGSEVGPTASPIVTRRKGKEVMVEFDTLKKKKLQEQIDTQVARELEEQQEKEHIRMNEQIARDAEVARIHAEEELQGMIDNLDQSNETIAKYLQEYQDFASELPLEKRIELISDLVKYQDNYSKVYKFQNEPASPVRDVSEGEACPTDSGFIADQDRATIAKSFTLPYDSAPRVTSLAADEGNKPASPLGDGSQGEACPTVTGLEAGQDRANITKTSTLPRDSTPRVTSLAADEGKMELWVELKRLYEPDVEHQLWTHTQSMMHAPVEWKLYDTCGVHHVTSKDQEIFMLVEKDCPLRKASEEFPLAEKFPTANEDKLPLLSQSDATAEELCATAEVKE
nr:hypothetical protein [Tanacetum cinerariifolium]